MASSGDTHLPRSRSQNAATASQANGSITIQGISTTIETVDIVVGFSKKGSIPTPKDVNDLLAKASNRERIQVIENGKGQRADLYSIENLAACNSLLPGERILSAFLLHITADTLLTEGWDSKLIASWLHTGDENAVLSPIHKAGHPQVMAAENWLDTNILRCIPSNPPHQAKTKNKENKGIQTIPASFIDSEFLFGPLRLAPELNYIQNKYQNKDHLIDVESALLWMAGFNLYHPLIPLLQSESPSTAPRTVLVPMPNAQSPMRSGGEYQRWTGIDSQLASVCQAARQGQFPAWAHRSYSVNATIRHHGEGFTIVDDFLEEDLYKELRDQLICLDYQHINTSGQIQRAWHIQDRFPLRGTTDWFFDPGEQQEQEAMLLDIQATMVTPIDSFMQAVYNFQDRHIPFVGKHGQDWQEFSASAWIYPPGTGLSMHNDGVNIYRGAYAYFLNNEWRSHWGGLLIVMDQEVNQAVQRHESKSDPHIWYRRRWLHENELEQLIAEAGGLGTCILPRRNRIVFLNSEVYHMVTRINEEAGDHLRLSLAGFFKVKKKSS